MIAHFEIVKALDKENYKKVADLPSDSEALNMRSCVQGSLSRNTGTWIQI